MKIFISMKTFTGSSRQKIYAIFCSLEGHHINYSTIHSTVSVLISIQSYPYSEKSIEKQLLMKFEEPNYSCISYPSNNIIVTVFQ